MKFTYELKQVVSSMQQGQIFVFSQEGWKNFRWGASSAIYGAVLDSLGGA